MLVAQLHVNNLIYQWHDERQVHCKLCHPIIKFNHDTLTTTGSCIGMSTPYKQISDNIPNIPYPLALALYLIIGTFCS